MLVAGNGTGSPFYSGERHHALLGELVVILGQVDEIMIGTVQRLLRVDRDAANTIASQQRARVWAEVIRNAPEGPDVRWLVDHAKAELQEVSNARNDFVHGWYDVTGGYVQPGYVQPGYVEEPTVTVRRVQKPGPLRLVSELQPVRNRAARLSCVVAHIDHLLGESRASPSPWLERLAPSLPPRPPPDGTRLR